MSYHCPDCNNDEDFYRLERHTDIRRATYDPEGDCFSGSTTFQENEEVEEIAVYCSECCEKVEADDEEEDHDETSDEPDDLPDYSFSAADCAPDHMRWRE